MTEQELRYQVIADATSTTVTKYEETYKGYTVYNVFRDYYAGDKLLMRKLNSTISCIPRDFRIVDSMEEIPKHYVIWSIGKNMTYGYIPFAERVSYNEDDDDYYSINISTMLAIKVSDNLWESYANMPLTDKYEEALIEVLKQWY